MGGCNTIRFMFQKDHLGSGAEYELVEEGELLERHRVVSAPTLMRDGKGHVQMRGTCPSFHKPGVVL